MTTSMRGGRRGTKRLDLTALREVLKDSRVWASHGVVIQPDGEAGAEHWDLVTSGANVTDVVVEVLLVPANVEVTARLNMLGVVQVPAVGDEVLVSFPDGQLDWMPTIVARLSSGRVPNPTGQGPSPATILVCPPAGGRVLVYDGDTGEAESLVKRSEFVGHTHGPGSFTTPAAGGGGGPVTGTSAGAASVTGTTVLLAK